MKLLPQLLVLVVLFYDASGADLRFVITPNNTCVPRGQQAEFPCRAEAGNFTAGQKWMVTTAESGPTFLGPANPGEFPQLPAPYEWIVDSCGNENVAAGLRVVTADNKFNTASFQCIASDQGHSTLTAPAVALKVTDPFSTFSCQNVICPQAPFVPEMNDKCTVHWARPKTVSCGSITGYNVTIAMASTSVSAADFMYETAALEPYTSYTATVTAINDVNMTSCSLDFTTSEQAPVNFTLQFISLIPLLTATFTLTPTVARPPRVANYSITITDVTGQQVGTLQIFPGSSSSLSLDISSLPQCMNYTVSVTASNTGGSATTSTTLSLGPLTSLEVSCVAGEDGCYLEASCVPSQPGLVSGCRLDYNSSAGAASRNVTQLSTSSRIASVSCDNQTISYTGRAYDSMLRALGCPHSGMTKCPAPKECTALGTIVNGTLQYNSTASSASGNFTGGTVATYSCADGYELVGGEKRTCLLVGTWTGAEPQCEVVTPTATGLPGWAFAIIVIIILVVVVLVVALVAFLLWRRVLRGKCIFSKANTSRRSKPMVVSQDDLEMDDKADYKVIGPGKAQGQSKAQPPAPQKNPDGLVYADVGTYHKRPHHIPSAPKEPEGVQYSAIMFLKEKSPEAVKPLPADDLLTLDNLLRQLSTVVHAWYIIGKHLNWSSECPPGADQGDWTGRPQCYGGGSGSAGAGRLHAVGRRHQPRV